MLNFIFSVWQKATEACLYNLAFLLFDQKYYNAMNFASLCFEQIY